MGEDKLSDWRSERDIGCGEERVNTAGETISYVGPTPTGFIYDVVVRGLTSVSMWGESDTIEDAKRKADEKAVKLGWALP